MASWLERAIAVGLAAGLICAAGGERAGAQDMPPMLVPAAPAPPVTSIKPTVSTPATQQPSAAQLDGLVAPIALYPDPLLGDVLMAATYPGEIAEAARWVRSPTNRALGSDALIAARKAKGWNPSIMALVPFPNVLTTMADKHDWTEQLGKAFFARQADVMASVQRLRHAALAAGSLKATPQCHCVIQTGGEIISIQPSEAELVSVPIYNPAVAFGDWADAAHPPVAFPLPSGFVLAPGTAVGFNPAVEVALFGPIWGWGAIDWVNRHIVVDEARYKVLAPDHIGFAGNVWVREPPARKVTHLAAAVVTRPSHHAKSKAIRHLAATPAPPPPPSYWWGPPFRGWGPPPGAVVPPPPPHYIARNWYNGYYFDPYR